MGSSMLAARYAKAVYAVAAEAGIQDRVFDELREVKSALERDAQIREFIASPLINTETRESALKAALANAKLADETKAFLLLLAAKSRLNIFDEIVLAYQQQSDDSHGVVRGTVRSAAVLAPEQRKQIETIVGNATKKQAILTYKEDATVIGGLIAEVGSYTFDDTLSSHLRRIKEELNRREH